MVVERLVLVLALLLRELLGRELQRVGAMEHLPCERERGDEHGDRPQTDRPGRHRDEDAEQREAHVGDDELTEHATVHLAQDRVERGPGLDRLPFRDQDRVDRVADDGREQDRRSDDEPAVVQIRQTAEDLALRQDRERDLRSDEDRGEHRDLAPELTDVRRPQEHDQSGDGRRVEQRDGQLQREAQAEVERHRHRHRHEIDDHDRHDPHDDRQQVRPTGERRRVLGDLEGEEAEERHRDEQLVRLQEPPASLPEIAFGAIGPAATLRPGHRAPRRVTSPAGSERGDGASIRRSRWQRPRT